MTKQWEKALERLSDNSKRWLLVVGSHLGASSGVPLPFHQTAWSPSITELVRYHVFQTQSREAALEIEKALIAGKPPLGLVADDLEEQDKWLQGHTSSLLPQGPIMHIAELAKHDMFNGIASCAYDSLLPNALTLLEVPFSQCTLEQPQVAKGKLPLLREYDDKLFQDTMAHREREAQFLRTRFRTLMDDVDGVLLIGHPPYTTDLFDVLQEALNERKKLQVVWLQEELRLSSIMEKSPSMEEPISWLKNLGQRAIVAEVNEFSQALHQIAEGRQISLTAWAKYNAPKKWTNVLESTVDVRPILLYVPGLSLFSELLKKLPRLSLKAVLSFTFLLLFLSSWLHYREYKHFQRQMKGAKTFIKQARSLLQRKSTGLLSLNKAEEKLEQADTSLQKVRFPTKKFWILKWLSRELKERHQEQKNQSRKVRANQLLPKLIRAQMLKQLDENQLMKRLSSFPEVIVSEVKTQKSKFKVLKKSPIKRQHPLSFYRTYRHQLLLSSNVMLLRVMIYKHTLQVLERKSQVFVLDLRLRGTLEDQIFEQARMISGYVGKRKKQFQRTGLLRWLNSGKATFIFQHLDTAGSMQRNLSRIERLLQKYPKCRTLLTTYLQSSSQVLAQHTKRFLQLQIKPYTFRDARKFLKHKTSSSFFEGVMSNTHLRWNWSKPLVMAMLVEYYRGVGQAPRGLGVLYERLIRRMLVPKRLSTYRKFLALEILSFHSLRTGQSIFTTDQARKWIANLQVLFTERKFLSFIQDAVEQGVIRRHSKHQLSFVDKHFRLLFAARYLRTQSFTLQKSFLLQQSTLFMAFYVGVQPKVERLVRSWIGDFQRVEAEIKKRELEGEWVNPLFPSLVHAALAVHNGDVSPQVIRKLENILFYWLEETEQYSPFGPKFVQLLITALDFLSTASSRYRILEGIAKNSDLDNRLLRLTARSSSDIYEITIMKWLLRIRTQKDKREERQAYDEERWPLSPEKRGRPDRLARRFKVAILNGLTTLIQIGTPSALQFVTKYISPKHDPRFRPKTWHRIRRHAIKRMFSNGHFSSILPLFEQLAKKDPYTWRGLFPRLYQTQHPQVAHLLFELLSTPSPFFPELLRWEEIKTQNKKERAAHDKMFLAFYEKLKIQFAEIKKKLIKVKTKAEKKTLLKEVLALRKKIPIVRNSKPKLLKMTKELKRKKRDFDRQMRTKRSLVVALARFDKKISIPLFRKLFQTIKGQQDLRIYGVYGLSLMNDASFFPAIKALIEKHFQQPPKAHLPKSWRKEQNQILSNSLVHFGTIEAFNLFIRLYRDDGWRKLNGLMDYQMNDFGLSEMHRFALESLLCSPKSKKVNSYAFLKILSKIQTPENRRLANRLLSLGMVNDEPAFRKEICGPNLLPYQLVKKRLPHERLIENVIAFHEPNDLPRVLGWIESDDFVVSVAALSGLWHSKHPAASTRLLQYALTDKYLTRFTIGGLKKPFRKFNEEVLLSALKKLLKVSKPASEYKSKWRYLRARKVRYKRIKLILELLGKHGSWKAITFLQPQQTSDSQTVKISYSIRKYIRRAVLSIAERLQGSRKWNAQAFFNAVPKPRAPEAQKPAKDPKVQPRSVAKSNPRSLNNTKQKSLRKTAVSMPISKPSLR